MMSRMLRWPNKEADTRKISFRVVFNLQQTKAAVCLSSRGEKSPPPMTSLWCSCCCSFLRKEKRGSSSAQKLTGGRREKSRKKKRKGDGDLLQSRCKAQLKAEPRRCVLLCCVDSGTPSGLCFTGVAPSPSFAHQTSVLKTVHVGVSLQLAGLLRDRDLTRLWGPAAAVSSETFWSGAENEWRRGKIQTGGCGGRRSGKERPYHPVHPGTDSTTRVEHTVDLSVG